MTDNDNWVTHWRQVGTGVNPPTPADPHAMAAVAVRRTRTRRAALAGGSVAGIVAMVAGTAFAMGGAGQTPEVLPGAGVASTSETGSAIPADGRTPADWHSEQWHDLSYALPPEFATDGPNPPEPGIESVTWSDNRDPDVHRSVYVEIVTPDFEFYDTDAGGLRSTAGTDAEAFDVAGAKVATIEDMTDDLRQAAGIAGGGDAAGNGGPDAPRVARFIVHPDGGDERYVIVLNLPAEGSDELVEGLQDSLRVD
ncbi:hypothetical protein GCM10027059_09980 [Myceligenerans halotolerans]